MSRNTIEKVVSYIKLSIKMLFALCGILMSVGIIIGGIRYMVENDAIWMLFVSIPSALLLVLGVIGYVGHTIEEWKDDNDIGDNSIDLRKVHTELKPQISKIKKPYKYYLYVLWRLFFTILCCLLYLGAVGLIIYWLVNVDWIHNLFFEDTVIAFIIFAIPLGWIVILIIQLLVEIWKWGIARRSEDWLKDNYYGVSLKEHSVNKIYQEKIVLTTNDFYNKWESNIKNEKELSTLFPDFTKTYIQLEYSRIYPNRKDDVVNVDIPLYYLKNTYSKEDCTRIIAETKLTNGEKTLDSILNAPLVTIKDLESLLSKVKNHKVIVRKVENAIRFHVIANDGLHNIIFIDKYSSISDIVDLCSSSFLQGLIPYGKLSIVAFYKEYSTSEFKSLCLHYKDIERFNERLPLIEQNIQKWRNRICGYPYCYFYNYYPQSMSNISFEDDQIRQNIYDFKDSSPGNRPRCYYAFADYVSIQIKYTLGCKAASQVSFVCVPSSSPIVTEERLKDFYSLVCKKTGLDNAYFYIFGEGDITPKHLGGTGLDRIVLDKKYFQGRKVVIFDDIVTRGTTMQRMVSALNDCGATVLFIISLAKTTHHISPHPFDSNEAILLEAAAESYFNCLRD